MVAVIFFGEVEWTQTNKKKIERDLGMQIPSNSNNDSFEDAEATDPPTLANIADQLEGGEEIDSEVSEENDRQSNNNQEDTQAGGNTKAAMPDDDNNGGDGNAANAANAGGPKAVNANQLQTLLHFDDNQCEAFINWIKFFKTARLMYNWSIDSLVQVAKAMRKLCAQFF